MRCKFCEDMLGLEIDAVDLEQSYYIDAKYIDNGIYIESYCQGLNNFLCFDNSAKEYIRGRIRIKFCPICGRNLEREESK